MHFYEASIITTIDGLHCQVYGNEHPTNAILVKPKYIPTDKIECDALPYRFISGKRMNRLDLWIKDQDKLRKYVEDFKKAYPQYIAGDENLVFAVPIDCIERVYYPRKGFKELMAMPSQHLDPHLAKVVGLGKLLLSLGLSVEDLGITYSTLMGHYSDVVSDINFIIYGKDKFWSLLQRLEKVEHPLLRWKTREEWLAFRKKRNRENIFTEEEFLRVMMRKKTEGYFDGSLFILFCAENPGETWYKFGDKKYSQKGLVVIRAVVKDDHDSVVRPGMYAVEDTPVTKMKTHIVKQVVFYSRDYCLLAKKGEVIECYGQLEDVQTDSGERYSRIVVGRFDSYLDERREKEYIKLVSRCEFCDEAALKVGDRTSYGAIVLHKEGVGVNGWFATLSPKTGGNPEKDFTIQVMPVQHVRHISHVSHNRDLAANQGIMIAKVSAAINAVMLDEGRQDENDEGMIRIGMYGKSKHPDEHLHLKLFPWTGAIGQPYTVDSSFNVQMKPVKKELIPPKRFEQLTKKLLKAFV